MLIIVCVTYHGICHIVAQGLSGELLGKINDFKQLSSAFAK